MALTGHASGAPFALLNLDDDGGELSAIVLHAAPTMTQVDWSWLGDTGSSTCPDGQSELVPTIASTTNIGPDSVRIYTRTMSLAFLRDRLNNQALLNIQARLSVMEVGSTEVSGRRTLGRAIAVPSESVPQKTENFGNLKLGTRYPPVIHTGNPSNPASVIARLCFRTGADPNIPFGSGRSVGPGDPWSSGYFALGGMRQQVTACLCGARNSSGQWARTDSEDGYSYIMDATWRQNVGCSTN